jgi:hypothetical protein
MLEVQSSIDRIDRIIKYRDLRETLGVVLAVPLFAWTAFETPFVLSKIACVLIILFGFYVVYRLRKAKQHQHATVSGTYLEYLHQTNAHLHAQKQMLEKSLYWYIIPGYAAITLFTLGAGVVQAIIKMQVLSLTLGVVFYFLNKRRIKKTLAPRIEKIDKLIALLEQQ